MAIRKFQMFKSLALSITLMVFVCFATSSDGYAQKMEKFNIILQTDQTFTKIIKEYRQLNQDTYISFDIICNCYAGKSNPNFTFNSRVQKIEYLEAMPNSVISLKNFVNYVNQHMGGALYRGRTFLIERISNNLYIKYEVNFQANEGLE